MTLSHEYPKWIHAEGKSSVIVNDAAAEATQLAEWAAVAPIQSVSEQPANKVEGNLLVNVTQSAAPPMGAAPNSLTMPKRPGWPKGKPRPAKQK